MIKDLCAALWAWAITPIGAKGGTHRRGDQPDSFGGRYRGRHRLSKKDISPEAGAWLRKHQRDFAGAYARAQGRVA